MTKLKYYISILKAEVNYFPKTFGYFFSKKKKAIYIGCIGQGNLGDEAVYVAIQKLLKEKIHLYPISYAKPSSGRYLRRWLFQSPELIILGGGTIIKKKKSESYLKLFSEYHNSYPKAKLIVYGAGVADPILAAQIGFSTDVPGWKAILNKCSFISVRGNISKAILQEDWRIAPEINILHDPAIFFKRNTLKKKRKQKRIGINFCNIIGRVYGLNQSSIELFANSLVVKLITEGWEVFLYPTAKSDIGYMKKIFGAEIISKIEIYNDFEDIEMSLSFLEGLDVFVGQRLHSVIFSAITYTPFHAIEYESKTSDFLNSLGLKNVTSRTDELEVNQVMDKINSLFTNLEENQKKLYQLVNEAHNEQVFVTQKLLNQF